MRILIGRRYFNQGALKYNGVILGTEESPFQITELQGFEMAPIRNNSNEWSGKDGGYMSAQLFSGREVTINGFYYDANYCCEEGNITSPREKLINFLKIRKQFPIFIELNSGKIFYTEGYITNFQCPYTHWRTGEFTMTFFCPDADIKEAEQFGDVDSVIKSTLLHKESYGGHISPDTMPVLFESGHNSTVIDYKGSSICYPTIILNGPFTQDIILLHNNLNKYVKILYTLPAGAQMKIDMNSRQVTVNGSSISLYIDENSEWWYLQEGLNQIYLLSGDLDNDEKVGTISWTNNYQGF